MAKTNNPSMARKRAPTNSRWREVYAGLMDWRIKEPTESVMDEISKNLIEFATDEKQDKNVIMSSFFLSKGIPYTTWTAWEKSGKWPNFEKALSVARETMGERRTRKLFERDPNNMKDTIRFYDPEYRNRYDEDVLNKQNANAGNGITVVEVPAAEKTDLAHAPKGLNEN